MGDLLQQLLFEFRGGNLLYVTVDGAGRTWDRHLIAVFMLSVWMRSRPTWTPPPASERLWPFPWVAQVASISALFWVLSRQEFSASILV